MVELLVLKIHAANEYRQPRGDSTNPPRIWEQRGLRRWRGEAGQAVAGLTAVCWNAALEECQEEVVLWSSIATLQLLPR